MNGDDIGIVDGKNGWNGLKQIGLAAEHGGALGERAGGRHHGFFVMPRERAAMIRAAALRAMAVRQASVDPQRGVHRSDGLAGLRRIDRERRSLGDFSRGMSQ